MHDKFSTGDCSIFALRGKIKKSVKRFLYQVAYTVESLYSGRHLGAKFCPGVALSRWLICTKRVYLGLSEVALIEGCPHVRVAFMRGSTVLILCTLCTSVNRAWFELFILQM